MILFTEMRTRPIWVVYMRLVPVGNERNNPGDRCDDSEQDSWSVAFVVCHIDRSRSTYTDVWTGSNLRGNVLRYSEENTISNHT